LRGQPVLIVQHQKEDWERIQTETYLVLFRNAAGKKAEVRKRICDNDENIEEVMKAARKFMRIMDYLYDRWERNRKRRKFGNDYDIDP
jgi:hypothetical protein